MEIEFLGANCFRVKTKGATIIVDDNLKKIGGKSVQSEKTVALYTSLDVKGDTVIDSRLTIDSAGEFEIGDVTVTGVQTRSHLDEAGGLSATVFQFMFEGQTVTILGHVHPDVAADVLELVSGTEVLIVPIGGNGYTLDPAGAASAVKKIEPGVVIPSQYEIEGLNYEVPASPLEEFTKIMPTVEGAEPANSFKLGKSVEDSTTQTRVFVLSRVEK